MSAGRPAIGAGLPSLRYAALARPGGGSGPAKAASVLAADVDAYAVASIVLNSEANGVRVDVTEDDMIGHACVWDVVLVGDMCYERPLAERLLLWLQSCGARVLLGDPGRSYFPKSGVEKLATYRVQTTRELEDREIRETSVYQLKPSP